MKMNELMIDDWVYIKEYPRTREAKRVTANHFVRSLYDFEPIPLTEEILKANGFRFNDEEYEYQMEGFPSVIFDYFSACIYWQGHLLRFYYVHEFQHALRLCGLNELADTFKV